MNANLEAQFETDPLSSATLRKLSERRDGPSLLRFGLQLAAFVSAAMLVPLCARHPLLSAASMILLGAIWASLFAPLHECIHRTAFRSQRWNIFGAWLGAVPFGVAPAAFRAFHFAHHRHTNDPAEDPELQFLPNRSPVERGYRFVWLVLSLGLRPLALRVGLTLTFAFFPEQLWRRFIPWARSESAPRLAWESRLIAAFWLGGIVLVCSDRRFWGCLPALIFAHLFLGLWLTTEHTGLPATGSMFARTRSVISSPFVRWWLWNMNYHAEHHAWPAVPWHGLPELHEQVADRLNHQASGYLRVHADALLGREAGKPPL